MNFYFLLIPNNIFPCYNALAFLNIDNDKRSTIMPMVVLKLDDECEFYTLCFAGNKDVKPLTDFDSLEHAEILMNRINKSGYAITLTEPSCVREFSVGTLVEGKFTPHFKASDLKHALKLINVNVDFDVEAPQEDATFLQYA